MTFRPVRVPVLCLAFSCVALGAAPVLADGGAFRSRTDLSAAQEVQDPPVESEGRGKAFIVFERDLSEARVFVRFSGLVGREVTRLHLHCNVAGANGPIAIGLIDLVSPANDNSTVISQSDGRIGGVLTNAEFPEVDPCPDVIGRPVNNIASLAAAIDAGLLYWNLHTDAFPAGELRGQVRPLRSR